jgi:hypothetical protein
MRRVLDLLLFSRLVSLSSLLLEDALHKHVTFLVMYVNDAEFLQ